MMACRYDLVTIGGGLAGAALGHALAERGRRVLVIERETCQPWHEAARRRFVAED
jgi:glycine/D-amino acid oxidase-like deaminating enzyme